MLAVKIIVFFAALVIAVVLGEKLKINAGIIALAFAFIIGIVFSVQNMNQVIMLFPVRVFYNMFIASLFYGFATENGTMDMLTKRLVYSFRNAQWAMPLVFFLIAFVLLACGASLEAALLFLSPIAFSVAREMKFSPILVSIALWGGGCAGNWVPWSGMFNSTSAMFIDSLGADGAYSGFVRMFVTFLLMMIAFMLITYFIHKGYKASGDVSIGEVNFEPINKRTLTILLVSIIIIVIPALINLIAPNPVTGWMTANLGIQSVAAIGAAVMALTKAANPIDVIKKRVPWNLIIMICGVSMLMGLATPLGITDAAAQLLSGGILPKWAVVPMLFLIMAVLSFFVSGMVLSPLMASFMPALLATGIPGVALVAAGQCGSIVASISPYSAGGALAISGCPDDLREEVAGGQIRYAIILTIVGTILALIGIFTIGA